MAPNGSWKWTPAELERLAENLTKFMKDPKRIYFKQWCVEEGIPSSYVTRFAEMSEAFAQALEKANDVQESRLVERGLSGEWNHAVARLILNSKFAYVERSAADLAATVAPVRTPPSSIEECDRLLAEVQEQKQLLEGIVNTAMQLPSIVVR